MTADRSVMERRLQAAFADSPTVAGAVMLDGRISAAIAARAGARPRVGGAGPMSGRRTPWMLPAAAVVALAVAGGGGLAWLSGRTAVPGPGSTAPVGALLPSASPSSSAKPSVAPSVVQSPTGERIMITPPPASPEPLPMMDAQAVVDALETQGGGVAAWWWSPGRRIDRGGRTGDRAGGAVALGVYPPPNAEIVLDPRADGLVQITSTGAEDGTPDPLGCATGSSGRYRIAGSVERLDLQLVDDPCRARVAAVQGTWQAVFRSHRATTLVLLQNNPQVEAFRLDQEAAGMSDQGVAILWGSRDGESPRTSAWRIVGMHRPDAAVKIGLPIRAAVVGACQLDADPESDVLLGTAEEALADIRARAGMDVVTTTTIPVGELALLRADIAVTDADRCPQRSLFAAGADPVEGGAVWRLPKPEPGASTAPVYLATVPARDGSTAAVAILVDPTVEGADLDAIAAQVLGAIDWQPELHPPAWPAGD